MLQCLLGETLRLAEEPRANGVDARAACRPLPCRSSLMVTSKWRSRRVSPWRKRCWFRCQEISTSISLIGTDLAATFSRTASTYMREENTTVKRLRDRLERGILGSARNAFVNGDPAGLRMTPSNDGTPTDAGEVHLATADIAPDRCCWPTDGVAVSGRRLPPDAVA
jgi:hypothetical protein